MTETPIERAQRLGQGKDVDPSQPTGQTAEDIARSHPGPGSNEELTRAAAKRAAAELPEAPDRDQRGQVTR